MAWVEFARDAINQMVAKHFVEGSPDDQPPFEGAVWVDADFATLVACHLTDAGKWEIKKPLPMAVYAPTDDEIAERAATDARAEAAARKLEGIEFEGVMCSATGQDQAGLLAVLNDIQMALTLGEPYSGTGFIFENGSVLNLHPGNAFAFAKVWRPFRRSFFPTV